MRNQRTGWKLAGARGMAAFMAVATGLQLGPARASPSDIFENPAPVVANEPGKAASVADGDTSIATQTGALTYSYPVSVPPGRNGMAPGLNLTYSSQAPIHGGVASGWNWNFSIPEIREDVSSARMRTHYPPLEAAQADPRLDDRFVSSMAGGRPLIRVGEPGDPAAYQYRAQGDGSFSRYERMKPGSDGAFKWRVYGTDGSIRYFGGSAQTPGCVNVSEGFAPLTREVDAFGSEILYTYESVVAGECRIKNIKWGQNPAAGVGTFAQVDFTYAADKTICGGVVSGSDSDYRTGKLIVTGASRLTTITSTAFAPGGSPASAVHTRTVALAYDVAAEACTLQHAPIKLLTTITESAWGVDSPLVTLPPKTFAYNSRTTTLVPPAAGQGVPWLIAGEEFLRKHSLAWGYRRNDERWPSVEAMLIDLDGDGLMDRLYNTSAGGSCSASWAKNLGPDPMNGGLLSFAARGTITLPRLKWHGPGLGWNPVAGATVAGIDNKEGCSLNGQATNYRNSQGVGSHTTSQCHDTTSCSPATDPADPGSYCNVAAPNMGTACPPQAGPDDLKLTYLAYRWMDITGDGLVDLVTAVHGSSNFYDIERGNLQVPFDSTQGEPSISGIPGLNQWPPCPGAGAVDRCANTGSLPNAYVQNCDHTGQCVPDWSAIGAAVETAPQVGCGTLMAKIGPNGGGGPGAPARAPYERCQGLYPWIIYPNLGAGVFATVPTIKYQPVPLESDNGDSSFGGPAIAATNHTIQDFDGDGALDALVHADPNIPGGAPDAWQVWFGDRTGQIGGRMHYFPTRSAQTGQLAGVGLNGAPISDSSVGLIDFNGDGSPDHWLIDGANNVNVALNKGLNLDLRTLTEGFTDTPIVGGVGVKPGADATFSWTLFPQPREGLSTATNRPVDVDGDGQIDVVRWNGGSPLVFWNYGGQLSGAGVSYPGDTSGVQRRVVASQIGSGADDMTWELESDLMDLDGDGRSEAASFPDPGSSPLWRAKPMYTQPPRLLQSVTNGRGATTTVTYASMHEVGVVEQDASLVVAGRPKASPTTQWVVKSMTTADAFSPGAATTSYAYKYPVHGKDDVGRFAFRGFEQVTTTAPSGSRTVQRYGYAPDWSGRLYATIVIPKLGSGEGDTDARSIDKSTWEERQLFGGAIKTYHATVAEHFTCKNGQRDPTDPNAAPPASPCNATTAGGYTATTSTLTTLASTTSGSSTPLLWQQTGSLLRAGTAAADGDRTTATTFALNADVAVYRLRPTTTLQRVRVSGAYVTHGRTATIWDPTYRVPVTDEVWFDGVDANRAITTRTFDMTTGNLTQETDPRGNPIGFEYDSRKQFVSAENQVFAHNLEHEYEYGTGTKLVTRGPQWASCALATPTPTCPGQLARDENRIRVDGLGRTIERFVSVNPDPALDYFALRKVEINSYVDTPSGATPTSVTHQAAIKETSPNVIVYAQDKTELDGRGRPTKKTVFANGAAVADQITTFHYNPDGTLKDATVPDPSLNTAATVLYDYTYDSLGRPKTIRRPDNTTLSSRSGVNLAYDGVTTTATEVAGGAGGQVGVTRTTNDSFGRLAKVEEQRVASPVTWATTLYGYDANDNVSQITDAESKVTALAHDYASRRVGISRINGATTKTWTYGYDKNGNMASETSPCTGAGCGPLHTTTTAYDAFNRPTSKLIAPRGMSAADRTLFAADQETMTWDLNANGRGQLVQWRSFGGGTEALLQWRTRDPQGRTTMNWQSFNRAGFSLVRSLLRSYHLGGAPSTTRYGDFANGGTFQTVSKVDLDARGLPSTIAISIDNGNTFPATSTVTQTRNVAGQVTKRSGAQPGNASVESNWTYDKLGRVGNQTVRKVATNGTFTAVAQQALTYHGNDDPKTLQHFLGTASKTFTYAYDLRHQLTGVTTSSTSFFGATYAYGVAGRFTKATQTRTATPPTITDLQVRDVNYLYGGADAEQVTALTNVSGGARFATFTYDDGGNMLTRCMGATFTPTCTGELLTYLYDGKDQLRRVTRRVNNVVTGSEEYWYDSDGNRSHVRKLNASGVATALVWYLDETEHHITPGTSVEPRALAHVSVGTPVARIERTGDFVAPIEYQFHGLASNTLATVAQSNGTINASFSYAPFGEVLDGTDGGGATAGAAAHKRRFNDKVQDDLSALTYYGARYYDKALIGWTQADPKYRFAPDAAWAEPRRANCYSFSGQNPLRYLDPDGRDLFDAIVAPAPGFGGADGVTAAASMLLSTAAGTPGMLADLAYSIITGDNGGGASAADIQNVVASVFGGEYAPSATNPTDPSDLAAGLGAPGVAPTTGGKKRPRESDTMTDAAVQLDGITGAQNQARIDSKTFDDGTRVSRSRDNNINDTTKSKQNLRNQTNRIKNKKDAEDADDADTPDPDPPIDPDPDQDVD